MPNKDWTDDDVKAEIAEAVRIVRADREKAEYQRLHEIHGKPPEDDGGDPDKKPPPKKDPADTDPPKKRSLYWGES